MAIVKSRCIVLCSGNGSNIPHIVHGISEGFLPIEIARIITNNPKSKSIELAQTYQIKSTILPQENEDRNSELINLVTEENPDFIVLAGYIKKIPKELINRFKNKILNIHPSLLPKFGGKGMYGIHVHAAVIAAGEKISGATVHLVTEEYDEGKIILQESIPIEANDTPDTLSKKVFDIEKKIYPLAIKIFLEENAP